jgi:hypothetical protein
MWEPQDLTTLWASTACYWDTFTFFFFFNILFGYMQMKCDVSSFLWPLAWTRLLYLLLWWLSCFEPHSLVTGMSGLPLADWFSCYLSLLCHPREYAEWSETVRFDWTGIGREHCGISLHWHLHGIITEEKRSKLQSALDWRRMEQEWRFKLCCHCSRLLSWSHHSLNLYWRVRIE